MSELVSGPPSRWTPSFTTRSVAIAVIVAVLMFADVRYGGERRAELSVAVLLAVSLVALGGRFPGAALCVVLAAVPLQLVVLAWLFKLGMPAALVKDLGYIKDVGTAGVLVAMLRGGHGLRQRKFDFLDWAAVTYVGIATIYLVIPTLAHGSLGNLPFQVRINAWRIDCTFVVLMFAARRVTFSKRSLHAARGVVVAVGLLMFAVAIRESISSSWYNHFLDFTVNLPNYDLAVLHAIPPAGGNYVINTTIAGLTVQREGSLFGDPIELGFYMVIPFALCLQQLGAHRPRPWVLVGLGGSAATLVMAETRSPVLAGGVAIVLAVVLAFQARSEGRYRLMVLVIAAAVLAVPLSAHSALRGRFANTVNSTSDADNVRHETATRQSITKIIHHPLGLGLGSNPSTGDRFSTSTITYSENSYLQVGVELGAPAMFAFVAMYLALLARLRDEARRRTANAAVAGGMWLAGWGLFVGGMFLHIWTLFAVSLTYWGVAGASLSEDAGAPRRRTGARSTHRAVPQAAKPALAHHA